MKAYLRVSGAVFALVVILHIARFIGEGMHVASDPYFVFGTVLSAGLCLWAWRLLRKNAEEK